MTATEIDCLIDDLTLEALGIDDLILIDDDDDDFEDLRHAVPMIRGSHHLYGIDDEIPF